MRWRVELLGDALDLQALGRDLSDGELQVFHDERKGEYLVQGARFERLSEYQAVLEEANRLIPVLNSLAKLSYGASSTIRVGAVYEPGPSGEDVTYIDMREVIGVDVRMSIDSPQPIARWLPVAERDAAVVKALRLYGAGVDDWASLYRILEVIEEDAGGRKAMASYCGIPDGTLKLLKHTANSPDAVGDGSRHGVQTSSAPPSPMSLTEAQALITTALLAWVDRKAAEMAGH